MKPLSLDFRERIVAAYEAGELSFEAVGRRFAVSGKVVAKLVRQKRELGTLTPLVHRRGRGGQPYCESQNALTSDTPQHPTILKTRDDSRKSSFEWHAERAENSSPRSL
jgi:transposase